MLTVVRAQPFEPFRICLTDGQSYEIRHPEWCMPGARVVIIGIPAHPTDPLFERTVKVDPLHVVRLEPLPTNTPPGGAAGNGPTNQPAN
jgi:hypothetical protein